MPREKLLLFSSNPGKIKEIKTILKDISQSLITLRDIIGLQDDEKIEEEGETFAENAQLKAETLGRRTGILTLADDSGLEIDALGGKPGVRSARFATSDTKRIAKVLSLLKGIPDAKRSARFVAAIAVFDPKEENTWIFQAVTKGKITESPRGSRGFGYDPIFYSLELGKTFSEATPEEKNSISHRARALRKAKAYLKERLT